MYNSRQGFFSELFCHRLVFELVLWSDFSIDTYVCVISFIASSTIEAENQVIAFSILVEVGRDIEFQNSEIITSCPCSHITMCLKSLGKILRL